MSCNCHSIPCCCRVAGSYPTTTTTICPDYTPCDVTATSDCVVHDGIELNNCFGISAGDTLTQIIDVIIARYPQCTTTTTSTTTTTTLPPGISTTTTTSTTSTTTTSSTTTTTTVRPPVGLLKITNNSSKPLTYLTITGGYTLTAGTIPLAAESIAYGTHGKTYSVRGGTINAGTLTLQFSGAGSISLYVNGNLIDCVNTQQTTTQVSFSELIIEQIDDIEIVISNFLCDGSTPPTTTTTTTTTTAYPGPTGLFRVQNTTTSGTLSYIDVSGGFTRTSGSNIPLSAGQTLTGTHGQVSLNGLITIYTNRAGSLNLYKNNILIYSVNVPDGSHTTQIASPEQILSGNDLVIVYKDQLRSETVNVKTFGALGNNAADDTTAISNAVKYVNYSGIPNLYFPTGTYIVTNGFNLLDNITVYGDGHSSLLKLNKQTYYTDLALQGAMFMSRVSYGNGNNNDGVVNNGVVTYPFPYGPNSSKTTLNITIKDLAIDIQKDPANYDGGYLVPNSGGQYRPPMPRAIIFYNPVGCTIENVKISNPWDGGILFATTIDGTESKNNTIKNCTILMQEWYQLNQDGSQNYQSIQQRSMIGIELRSHCNFSTNNGSACYDRDGAVPPNRCNCASKITRNLTDGSYTPSRMFNNIITNCTISNGSHCISFANARNNIISNNTITNGSHRGVILSSRSDDNTITNNTITLCGSTGVLLSYNSSRNTVSYNRISDVRAGEGQGIGANVIANDNIIEYNTITNSPQAGIRLSHGPTGNIIRNNIITGSNKNDTEQMGVRILANWSKYYYVDTLRYQDQLRADNNICIDNRISNVNVGVYMGDEKGFTGRLSGNVVDNTYINVVEDEKLNVSSYKGSTTSYEGTNNTVGYPCN
jgi:parallel beta-helix repeat protein